MSALRLGLALLLTGFVADASARCVPLSSYTNGQFLDELFQRADAVVHAKVTKVVNAYEARIEIVEAFKGNPAVLKSDLYAHTSVALRFEADQEAVFVVTRGQVSGCGALPATPDLLAHFRAHRR